MMIPAQEIAARSGTLWECQSQRPFLRGNIYRLKLREAYDDITPHKDLALRAKAVEELSYPFAEPHGDYFFSERSARRFNALQSFGYRQWSDATGVYLEMPDKEAIESRWKLLGKAKQLSIKSIEEEEGDIPFIEAFLTHDAFLSRKHLFVHDGFYHTMAQLVCLLEEDVDEELERVKGFVANIYHKILDRKQRCLKLDFPRLDFFLGNFIDAIAQYDSKKQLSQVGDTFLSGYIDGGKLGELWKGLIDNT